MKVLAVSDNHRNIEEIRNAVSRIGLVSELAIHEGTLSGVTTLPVKGETDVLMLDCRNLGTAPLADVERLGTFYPELNVILIVDQESPELLLRALRLGVREVLKAPLVMEEVRSAFQRISQKRTNGQKGDGQVLAFVSCKGGSGTSFLATNLGYVLAADTDKRVVLIDLNLQFGDAVLYVSDRRPSISLIDVVCDVEHLDMALLRSAMIDVLPNYGVISAPEDPTQSVDVRPSHIESLLRFARANFDYVLLDMSRSLDTCTIQALDIADHIYPVLQLTLPFLRDAKRLFDVFRSLDYGPAKIRPLINRVEHSPAALTEADAEKLLSYKIFMTLPNHYKSVTASVNQGVPIQKLDAASPVARSLQELADQISGRSIQNRKGLFSRFFARS